MLSLIFLSFWIQIGPDLLRFTRVFHERLRQDRQADEKMFQLGESLGAQFETLEHINFQLSALHAACSLDPLTAPALQVQAQGLAQVQEALLIKIRCAHLAQKILAKMSMSSHFRSSAPCKLPGLLLWRRPLRYELLGNHFGIQVHGQATGTSWSFHHPDVRAL